MTGGNIIALLNNGGASLKKWVMASFNLGTNDNLTAPTKAPIITSLPPRPTGSERNFYTGAQTLG